MPKQTFFNLPEEKRELLIDLAIDEFAKNDYDLASISRMVTRANIAKGSFYQYFEDKQDLYLYLLDLAAQEKMALLREQQPPDPDMGLFEKIRWLFAANLHFQLARPRLNQVAYRAIYGNNALRGDTLAIWRENAAGYYRELIQKGMEQGDIDPQIDPALAAFILGTILNEFGNYLVEKLNLDLNRMIDTQLPEQIYQEMMAEVDNLLFFLQGGFGIRSD